MMKIMNGGMMKKDELQIVSVDWLDAMSDDNTWQDLKELQEQKLRPVTSVGYLIKEDKDKKEQIEYIGMDDQIGFLVDSEKFDEKFACCK